MSIIARCECGNKMALSDALAGRTIKCSKCGGAVLVPAVSNSISAASRQKMANQATPAVEVSPGVLISMTVGMALVVIVLALYFGPWTVGKQWEAMRVKANDQVTDVVQFALQAYESEHGMYDAAVAHHVPQTEGEATFVTPYMAFSMPRRIIFTGKTNQGNYMGEYSPQTGEITATIETGGFSVGGLVDVNKATGSFQITGREKDGQAQAESDGIPLKIVERKHSDHDE